MKKLFIIFSLLTIISCGSIIDSVVSDISTGVFKYARQDTCKKVLVAKIIDYRQVNGSFPKQLSDLDTININSAQHQIAMNLMLLPDSMQLASSKSDFEKTWQNSCPNQIDSLSVIPYQNDSVDVFIKIVKFKVDSSYSTFLDKRRLIFENDAYTSLKYQLINIRSYNKDGNEINMGFKMNQKD